MPKENPAELTFKGLQTLLLRLGFTQVNRVENSLVMEHAGSGALVVLSIPSDGRTVRPADLLSVWVREAHGIAADSVIEQLKIGRLPLAS